MFFMRGEVIKLSLIAGIILIPFEKSDTAYIVKGYLDLRKTLAYSDVK